MSLHFDIGYRGAPETIHALARSTDFPGNIDSLVSGCIEAYKEKRTDHLQQMLAGFLSAKMEKGINAPCQRKITMHRALACLDAHDRLRQFDPLTKTAAGLMGDQVDSATEALKVMFGAMTEEQRQYALDLTLLYVTRDGGEKNIHRTAALLQSGADANTHQGDALGYAAMNGDMDSLRHLYIHNGDFSLPEKFTSGAVNPTVFERLKAAEEAFKAEGIEKKSVTEPRRAFTP